MFFFFKAGAARGKGRMPSLFLSQDAESILKVAMETIVFVAAVIGAAERDESSIFVMSQHLIHTHK